MLPVNINYKISSVLDNSNVEITTEKVGLIESWDSLSCGEKIHLLLILTRKKWVTELKVKDKRCYKDKIFCVNKLLEQLGLVYAKNWRVKSNGERIEWVQVAANKRILHYVLRRRCGPTSFEAGILYGFPVTAVLGFMELIPKKMTKSSKKHPAFYYLSGVYSKEYFIEEEWYFLQLWDDLKEVSPKIVDEAEEEFRKLSK